MAYVNIMGTPAYVPDGQGQSSATIEDAMKADYSKMGQAPTPMQPQQPQQQSQQPPWAQPMQQGFQGGMQSQPGMAQLMAYFQQMQGQQAGGMAGPSDRREGGIGMQFPNPSNQQQIPQDPNQAVIGGGGMQNTYGPYQPGGGNAIPPWMQVPTANSGSQMPPGYSPYQPMPFDPSTQPTPQPFYGDPSSTWGFGNTGGIQNQPGGGPQSTYGYGDTGGQNPFLTNQMFSLGRN